MRAILAAVMALALAWATTADRVACPDGCTDEAQHDATSTPSGCGLCHGWNGAAPTAPTAPPSLPAPPLAAVPSRVQAPHLVPIDHPPRIA